MAPVDQTTVKHTVVEREAWLSAQRAHLSREKELTALRDELSRERRNLPWLEITKPYEFTGPGGPRSLADVFDGRSQLLVYHFMFGPDWDEGCPSCSFWADNFDGTTVHLAHRDLTMVAVSRAPIDKINAYKQRMGWTFDWFSSAASDFNADMGVGFSTGSPGEAGSNYNFGTQSFGGEEAPGISVFHRSGDGRVFLTYQTFARGLDLVNGAYHLLDLTPEGRDEADLPYTMAWLRRHDAYTD